MNDKMKILVIDDDKIQLNQAGEILRTQYEVFMVKSAEAGMKLLMKKEKPDLILLDISMPEMDGFEATQEIRMWENDKDRHVVIIAMTANALIDDRQRCLQVGMDDYISKPIHPHELKDTLERWIK